MKQIYILSTCNEWKEHSSMFPVAASLSITKIKNLIIQLIKKGDMTYMGRCSVANPTKELQTRVFREDFKVRGAEFAFNSLEYGYVNVMEDGVME